MIICLQTICSIYTHGLIQRFRDFFLLCVQNLAHRRFSVWERHFPLVQFLRHIREIICSRPLLYHFWCTTLENLYFTSGGGSGFCKAKRHRFLRIQHYCAGIREHGEREHTPRNAVYAGAEKSRSLSRRTNSAETHAAHGRCTVPNTGQNKALVKSTEMNLPLITALERTMELLPSKQWNAA